MSKKRKTTLKVLIIATIFLASLVLTSIVADNLKPIMLTAQVPSGLSSGPVLIFESPTPANHELVEKVQDIFPSDTFVEVNISISGQDLNNFVFNWNGQEHRLYDDSLALAYNFDNNPDIGETSSYFVDISKYGNNAYCSGDSCPQATTGKYGGALHFDGNDMIYIEDCSSLLSNEGTISFWIKYDSVEGSTYNIFSIYEQGNENTDYFRVRKYYYQGTDAMNVRIKDNDNELVNAFPNPYPGSKDTEWHHIVVTRNSSDIIFILDGEDTRVHHLRTTSNGPYWTDHLNFANVACSIGGSSFRGSIDEFKVYNRIIPNETINCWGYGAETYPYTQSVGPIGGGVGYVDIVNPQDANYVVSTKTQLLSALSQATSGQIVYVDDNAQIDLSGVVNVVIPQGVTLASGRGRAGSQGGLLYKKDMSGGNILFLPEKNSRITGLRIQGPANFTGGTRYDDNSGGIFMRGSNADNVEIDNCELFQWGYTAIAFMWGTQGGHVHHNYLYWNKGHLGYGTVVGSGAFATIEANYYHYSSCCAAASGTGSSYVARYNIFTKEWLPSGGQHLFDMHGISYEEQWTRMGYWRFSRGQGNVAYGSARSNTCTLKNMDNSDWVQPSVYKHYSYALDFDGVNDYLDCGNRNSLNDPTNKISLDGFIKTTADPRNKNQMIAIKGNLANPGYYLYLNGDTDTIDFGIGNGRVVSMAMPQDLQNSWHHIGGTYDSNTLRIYYDGELMNSLSTSGNIAIVSQNFSIGAEAGGSRTFQGMIDELILYKEAINDEKMRLHYEGHVNMAGGRIIVEYNTAPSVPYFFGVNIRGRPKDRCLVYRNKFEEPNITLASHQTNVVSSTYAANGRYHGMEENMYTFDNCYYPKHIFQQGTLKKVNQDTWNFYYNAEKLANVNYSYYAWAEDTGGNSNYAYGRNDDIIYTASNPRYVNAKNYVKPNVTLMSPGHGTYDEDGQVTLTCNAIDNIYLENMTLQVWDSAGSSYYTNSVNITEWEDHWYNTKSWQLTLPEGNYTWNCLAYNMGYYGDWGNTNNALFIGEEPAGYIPPDPVEPPEPPQPPEPPPVEPPVEPPTEPPATSPPATTEPTGGGGGGATTPVGSSNVLPPLIQPQAPEPEPQPGEEEPGEELKGEESFIESLLFKEGKMRWEAILVIAITMMIIIYAVFYLSMQSKKI